MAGPHPVGKVSGGMIEGAHRKTRIVSTGNKGVTRSQTGADDAELGVAVLFQPVQAAAHVNHGLARRIYGSTNICGHRIIRALDLWRLAQIVVGETEA